jgi:hypothetical protein
VGVGDGTTGIMGPFEAAQGRFFTGQVIPLVVGAFGDVNEALEKVLKRFITGQVIPLVVGAFGHVNEALEKVLS